MTRIFAAAVLAVAALLVAPPHASADPEDHVPYCSGDQTPMANNCRFMPDQDFTRDAEGANPDLPTGPYPSHRAVVG